MPDIFQRLQQAIDSREAGSGVSAAELLELPDDLRRLLLLLVRANDAAAADLATAMGVEEPEVLAALESLEAKGLVRRVGEPDRPSYRAILAQRRGRTLPAGIWDSLASKLDRESDTDG